MELSPNLLCSIESFKKIVDMMCIHESVCMLDRNIKEIDNNHILAVQTKMDELLAKNEITKPQYDKYYETIQKCFEYLKSKQQNKRTELVKGFLKNLNMLDMSGDEKTFKLAFNKLRKDWGFLELVKICSGIMSRQQYIWLLTMGLEFELEHGVEGAKIILEEICQSN